jgi:hypothetical protein
VVSHSISSAAACGFLVFFETAQTFPSLASAKGLPVSAGKSQVLTFVVRSGMGAVPCGPQS